MGLSSKKVIISSSDGTLDWSQDSTTLLQAQALELTPPKPPPGMTKRNQPQQPEALKCPRCESGNTKFCYYNNYSKTQPRYFCKACRRHWTEGGTLRNVPLGGGRKNKRLVKPPPPPPAVSKAAAASSSSAAIAPTSNNISTTRSVIINSVNNNPQISGADHLYNDQKILREPSSEFQVLQGPMIISSSLEANNLIQSSSSGGYMYSTTGEGEVAAMEDSTVTTTTNNINIMPSTSSSNINITETWEVVGNNIVNGGGMEYWNWDDIDSLVSTDLNIGSWDIDSAEMIKP